ncbi:MAG: HPr family phosphocarrier protein [Treponema sp.]|nr:HPr family phosphocarrier protein [Treponema sp.]
MKTFEYTLKAADGIHARPAGVLVKEAAKFKSDITVACKGKEASAKKLFALMKLGAKQNDVITVTVSGEDEDEAFNAVSAFIGENF